MSEYALGIDIGGTFTDLVLADAAGSRHALKLLTTPDDPSRAVVDGVRDLLAQSKVSPDTVARVVHATTLFTNALIERKGAVTGLITTAGFRDVLEIGRERRFELYDLNIRMPEPLVPRDLRLEVAERMAADGSVVTEVDEAALQRAASALVEAGVAQTKRLRRALKLPCVINLPFDIKPFKKVFHKRNLRRKAFKFNAAAWIEHNCIGNGRQIIRALRKIIGIRHDEFTAFFETFNGLTNQLRLRKSCYR